MKGVRPVNGKKIYQQKKTVPFTGLTPNFNA